MLTSDWLRGTGTQFPSITDSVQSCALWYSSSALVRPCLLVEEYTWREKQEGWRETSKMSLVLGCLLSVKAEAHCGAAPIKAPSITDSVQAWVLRYSSSSSALARPRLVVEEYTWPEKQEAWQETNKMSLMLGCLLRLEAEAHCGAAPIFVCLGRTSPARRHFCRTASMRRGDTLSQNGVHVPSLSESKSRVSMLAQQSLPMLQCP